MKPLPRSASHPGNYSSSMRKFEQTHTMLNNMSGMEQFVFLISVCTKKGKCIGFNYASSGMAVPLSGLFTVLSGTC